MVSDTMPALANGASNNGAMGKMADDHMEDALTKRETYKAYSQMDKDTARQSAFSWANAIVPLYCLRAAVRLELPSILTPGTVLSTEEIARRIPTPSGQPPHDAMLERILRVLAAYDLVHESVETNAEGLVSERRFEGSPVLAFFVKTNDELKGEFQVTFDSYLDFTLDLQSYEMRDNLHVPVLNNAEDPLLIVQGKAFFDNDGTTGGTKFHRAMTCHAEIYLNLLLEKYDGFKSVKTLVDVGGGQGASIASIVAKYPSISGICFDLPHVVEAAPRQFPGVKFVGGNFFESIPECDAVFMKCVLHDWNDETCVKILKTIAKALPENGKIINYDAILPESSEPTNTSRVTLIHNCMMGMVNAGGQERTLAEFRELGAKAGFPRVELMATVDYLGVIEFHKN